MEIEKGKMGMHKFIEKISNKLVSEVGTRNPFEIAKYRNIKVRPFAKPTKLLGMYAVIKRNRFIFYNPYVDELMQKMVVAHELGHDILHRDIATETPFQEWALFDVRSITEYEANIFASHLLLDEKEIIDLAEQGYNDVQIASLLNVNINMLLFKLREMNRAGENINIRAIPDSNFFNGIDGKQNNQ